eukprot:scaffold3007_cov157-Amphora_coffeaeformis.AAC.4
MTFAHCLHEAAPIKLLLPYYGMVVPSENFLSLVFSSIISVLDTFCYRRVSDPLSVEHAKHTDMPCRKSSSHVSCFCSDDEIAFSQAGLILSACCLALVALQSYTTSLFLLECCARAEALAHCADRDVSRLSERYSMVIRQNRTFELPMLTHTFLGSTASRVFCLLASFDLYGITWTFCTVFGQNLSQNLPILDNDKYDDDANYKLYVAMFLFASVPLSCMSILDQMWVQMGFLVARMVMVAMMIITLIVACTNPGDMYFESRPQGPAYERGPGGFATFASLITILQTCIFSTAFQFSIPSMAGISANSKDIASCVRTAVWFALATNLLVAILVACYFGPVDVKDNNNLNWASYVGRNDGVGGRIVSNYVVLMAALDGLAVYPLNAIPLGEGLMAAVYGDETEFKAKNKWRRLGFRLLASLPQGIGAIFLNDLGALAKYAGVFTLLSYTLCPSLLYLFRKNHEGTKLAHGYILFAQILVFVTGGIRPHRGLRCTNFRCHYRRHWCGRLDTYLIT